MPDRDNTYSTNQIKKISQCHSSLGKRTRLASPKLDRWKDLNKAIIDWQNNDALDETSIKVAEENNFQFYDTIQKKILSDLFARFRTIYPKRNSNFNHEYLVKEAVKEIDGEEYGLTTHFAYEFEDENLDSSIAKIQYLVKTDKNKDTWKIWTNILLSNELKSYCAPL